MDNRIPIQLVLDDRNFLLQAKRAVDSIPLKKSIEFDSAPLKRITGDFNEFGKSLDAAVARVISFTATTRLLQGFGNSIAGITKSAIEVENAMTRVQSILGTTASQTKQFKKEIFDLANSGSTDFYKVAEAVEEFSRQGFTLAKTIEATKAAMVLAKLSGSDLKKTIEGITAVMATASNQTLEFIEVTDKIAAVDAKFATSSAGLLDGLKRFGGIAEQNGLVLDQQLGLLASIKQLSGRSEAVIGNSIKSLLVSFSNSSVQKELENIGVSVKDSEGNFKDLVQVGKELATVYDTLSASQKAFIRQKVGGKYQADAFEQFVRASKDTGSGSLVDKAIGVSENSTGSSLKRIETLNTSTKSQLEIFKNTLTQFGDAIGSKLTKPVVDEFISVVNTLGSVFSNNSEVAGVGEKIGNGIITGIRNVITQPGLVAGGVLLTNLIKKIGGDALKATTSILGVSKYKKDIAAIEQVQVATIMPKINEYDLRRIASLTTQAEKEREILNILNAQIKARNAAGQVNQFLNTVPGITNTNKLFTKTVKTKADGGLPEAFFKEAVDVSNGVGGATPHARPKKMMLNVGRGPETVVVNSDERIIRNFAGSGQDAVINREMMGYAGGALPKKIIGYHGTSMEFGGKIDPTKSMGENQGQGFYIFKRKSDAVSHAKDFLKDEPGQKKLIAGRFPISKLVPDYEVHTPQAISFLRNNPQLLQGIDTPIGTKGFRLIGGVADKTGISFTQKSPFSDNLIRKRLNIRTTGDVGTGMMFGPLFDSLRSGANSKLVRQFEESLINSSKGRAFRYIGEETKAYSKNISSGFIPYSTRGRLGYAGGYIGPTKRLFKHLGKRKVDLYRDDTEPAQYSGTTLLNGKAINRHININSKTPIFDLIHESGHDIDRGNLYKFGRPLTKRRGLDVSNITDKDVYNERVANKNAIGLMKKLGYGDEVIKKYVKDSFKPFTSYSRKGYPKPGALKNVSSGYIPSLSFQQRPFSFNAGDQRDMTQTVGTGSNFRPRFNTSSRTSTGTSYPQSTVSYTGDSGKASPQINKINLPIKQVLIDAFSDNGVQSTVKKSFGESFRSGVKSVVSNSLGGGKIGNAVARAPSFLVDAVESIRRPGSYIPKNKFFSKGLRDDLSRLPYSKIDYLSPYGDPNKANSQAISGVIASRNEAFRDSVRNKKEARETKRSARSAKLAGVGFGVSFFGGVASELLTGKNGEETAASRVSNSVFRSVGLAAIVASINPAIGAVVGAGLLVKETSNLVREVTAGGAYDSAVASYKKLTDEVSKSEASITSFAEATANFNEALGSGDTTRIETMVKSLTSAYSKLPSEFSNDLGKLNFDNPQDVSKIQESLSKFKEKNKREVAQKEFELKFQEFRKGGSFVERRDTTLLGFAGEGTDNADAFAAALLEGIDVSSIPNDIKEKIRKSQELTIQEYNSILPDSTLKRPTLVSPEFKEQSSLQRYAVNESLQRYVRGFDVATKQADASKKSLNLSSFLKSELDNYQLSQDRKFDKTSLKLDELSKSLELSSDTLTDFGRTTSQASLTILKSKLDVEKTLSSKKNEISVAILDFLESRTLNVESGNLARGSLKTFAQSGDFSKLLTDIKSSVGTGSIREIEDVALKALPALKRDNDSLIASIAFQKNSLIQERKNALTNDSIRTLGGGKVITPEQLSNIRSGISAQLKPRKDLKDVNAQFIERGGFGLSDYNLSRQERAFRTVQVNRQNAAIGEKSLSSIQELDSLGLLGIPTDPSTELGRASKELRNLTKFRVGRDFLNVSKSNQQNSVKSILDGYFSEINSSSKKEQGFNLIPEDLRKSINQDIAFSDFGSAKNRVSKFSDSVPGGNKNKPLLEEIVRILDINSIISKNSSEVAAAFADKIIKNNSGDELLNKITELNNIQTQMQKSVSSLESYFTSKFKSERTSLNNGIISKEKEVSLGLKKGIERTTSDLEDNERNRGKSVYSKEYSDRLQNTLNRLLNQYKDSQTKIGAAKIDNIVNNPNGVGAGLSNEFSALISSFSKTVDFFKSLGQNNNLGNGANTQTKITQESTANILVGIDLPQIIAGTDAIKELLSNEMTNIVSGILKENGFNIKTKPK